MATRSVRLVGLLLIIGLLSFLPAPARGGSGEGEDGCPMLDKAPEVLSQSAPTYPERARAEGAEGRVVLGLRVTTEGIVDSVAVKQGVDGYPELAEAAAAAARLWRFKPGEIKGTAVTTWVTVPVMFKLDKKKASSPE